jgi:hypothetical protein
MVKLTFGPSGRPQLKKTDVELDPVGIPHPIPSQK